MKIKLFDVLIILIAIGVITFSSYTAYVKKSTQVQLLIRGQSDEWIFNIDAEETVTVAGPAGTTVIKVQNKTAWVESSDCENQTCVAQGLLTKQGQWAACLPNSVLVIIQGADENDIDAVSR